MKKRKFKKLLATIGVASLCLMLLAGCGSKDASKDGGSSDDKIAFEKSSLLDKYESKKLADGITYKELQYTDKNNNLVLTLVVTNDTDDYISVSGGAQGLKDGEKTSQTSQRSTVLISPGTSAPCSFLLFNADSYTLRVDYDVRDDKDEALAKSAYKFDNYEFTEEDQLCEGNAYTKNKTLRLYYTFKETGKNLATVHILGFKDGKYVYHASDYMTYMDADKNEDYSTKISKNGDGGTVEFFACNENYKVEEIDNYIYFITGFYD